MCLICLVHEFDSNSPSIRRMEVKGERIDKLTDEVVFLELILRGAKVPSLSELKSNSEEFRQLLNRYFWHEYAKELEKHGIKAVGSLGELKKKSKLLSILLQRTYAASLCGNKRAKPIEMNRSALLEELRVRKVSDKFHSLPRRELVSCLEMALMKETAGLKVPGYEFGKTLVTSQDIAEYQYLLRGEKEKESAVDELEMQKEEERIESSLKRKFRKTLIEVIRKELCLRKVSLQRERSESVQVEREKVEPIEERSAMARLFSFLQSIPNPAKSEEDLLAETQEKDVNQLFNSLYNSNRWDEEYE